MHTVWVAHWQSWLELLPVTPELSKWKNPAVHLTFASLFLLNSCVFRIHRVLDDTLNLMRYKPLSLRWYQLSAGIHTWTHLAVCYLKCGGIGPHFYFHVELTPSGVSVRMHTHFHISLIHSNTSGSRCADALRLWRSAERKQHLTVCSSPHGPDSHWLPPATLTQAHSDRKYLEKHAVIKHAAIAHMLHKASNVVWTKIPSNQQLGMEYTCHICVLHTVMFIFFS